MLDLATEEYWIKMFGEPKEAVIKKHNCCMSNGMPSCLKEAYDKAHEVRQFEIEMYWKRALYFWGFEAAFMVAFSTLLARGSSIEGQFYYLLALSLFALVFTLLWRLALKGSKQWQENWEAHIDFLEDAISGKLYKTVLCERGNTNRFFSVSRVNEYINRLLIFMWIVAGSVCLVAPLEYADAVDQSVVSNSHGYIGPFLIFMFSVISGWILAWKLRTRFKRRENEIEMIPRAESTVKIVKSNGWMA